MFDSLRLVTLAGDPAEPARRECGRALEAAARATGADATLFAPTCPGVWNGGDYVWRSEYRDAATYRAAESSPEFARSAGALLADRALVARVEHVAFPPGANGGASPKRGLYRVALFCANQSPSEDRLARFALETCTMPSHIRSIRRWQLSRPDYASGSRPWTHVWEQEYDDLAGLNGAYMLHPCHWGDVDRWFDPEDPDWLIDTTLCHSFCETSKPVIGGGAS